MVCGMTDQHASGSVAIVGAGMAGLSCARVLADHGVPVTVFEKSRGPGGRMSTRRSADEQDVWQCDHGAQYFTARHPLFVEQVRRWQSAGAVAPWQGRIKTFGQRPDALASTSNNQKQNSRYVGTPRMTAPAHELAKNIELLNNQRITSITRSEQGWFLAVEDSAGLAGPFRHLVLAIPAQQAADLLHSYSTTNGQVPAITTAFKTALESCKQYALRPCWALMLNFDHALNPGFDAAFVNPADDDGHLLSWIACDTSKPGRPNLQGDSWLAHATPHWSEQHLEADPTQVTEAMLSAFRTLTRTTTAPSAVSLHRWRFAQTGNTDNCPGQLWLSDLNLGLCGDWLNNGRVEGAWLSGYGLARQVLTTQLQLNQKPD